MGRDRGVRKTNTGILQETEEKNIYLKKKKKKKIVRSGIRTHAHIRGPERSIPICKLSEGNQP